MTESFLRRSPLSALALEARAHAPPAAAGVTLVERAFRGQLALRGDAASKHFASAVREALGIAPPTEPNTVATRRDAALLWLGPDEWLVVVPEAATAKVAAALEAALAGEHHLVSDVSHARGVIGLGGGGAREVLAKGCSLDLDPRAFGPGRCAQSRFARCHALIHQLDDTPGYDLYVHRSFMEYAWAWVEDAAQEYGG